MLDSVFAAAGIFLRASGITKPGADNPHESIGAADVGALAAGPGGVILGGESARSP